MAKRHPTIDPDSGLGQRAGDWDIGVILVYTALFGTGYLLLG